MTEQIVQLDDRMSKTSEQNDSKSVISFRSNLTSFKDPKTKEESLLSEIEREINLLDTLCKTILSDLENSPLTARYVIEIQRVWDLLVKSHSNSKRVVDVNKEQLNIIYIKNLKLVEAEEKIRSEMKMVETLTQQVKRALKMVDMAHTREQGAQETIENLRQQINRLHSDVENKNRSSELGGELTMAKTKEAQAKERERMLAEISNLREKFNAAVSYQEELERKNSSADLRIAELRQEVENQANEKTKEARFKERFEEELIRVKKELTVKDSQIIALHEQIQDLQVKAVQNQSTIKELKLLSEKNGQTIDVLNQRLVKSQEDHQREVGLVDELRHTITLLNTKIKTNEDEIVKLLAEVAKTSTIQDAFKKKISRVEAQKNALEEQKSKLLIELQMLQRSIKDEQRKGKDDKTRLENTLKERDMVNKQLIRVNALVSEKEQVVKMTNQSKFYLEHDIDNARLELNRQSQHITALEKERDRHVADAVVLTKKLEAAIDDTKLQLVTINDYKKKLALTEGKLVSKVAECENMRFELSSCIKNLNEAQEDIIDFKNKSKVMRLTIEQLKEDVAGKEVLLIREQAALHKAQDEKEAMRLEIKKTEAELRETKAILGNLEADVTNLQHLVRYADSQHHRDIKEIEQLTSARETLNAQLVRRNDELAVIREKMKTMQSTIDGGQRQYTQRLEDIRILRLEIQRLSAEKEVLTRSIANMSDLRTEILHVERELNREREKARVLEEELQNPMNIHRWRKLEGYDPAKLNLIQKVRVQQKRLLQQNVKIVTMEERCAELERKHGHMEATLARYQHDQPERERAEEYKAKLASAEKRLKQLLGDLEMRMEHVKELKADLGKANTETAAWKEKFFEMKKTVEKLKQRTNDTKRPSEIQNSNSLNGRDSKIKELPPLLSKSKILGGGFSVSRSSI